MNETSPTTLVQETAARGAEQLQNIDIGSGARAVSRALHRAAECLREDGYRSVANMTDQVANKASNLASSGDKKDPMTLVHDVQSFAHQNPTAFIVGAAAVGFVLARFLTTSSRTAREEPRYEQYSESLDVPVAPSVYGEPLPGTHESPGGTR